MKCIFYVTLALILSAIPLQAGEMIIKDTGAGIVVEYAPDAEEAKGAQATRDADQEHEAQVIRAEQERLRKEEEHNAKWREIDAAARAQRRAEGEQVDEDH